MMLLGATPQTSHKSSRVLTGADYRPTEKPELITDPDNTKPVHWEDEESEELKAPMMANPEKAGMLDQMQNALEKFIRTTGIGEEQHQMQVDLTLLTFKNFEQMLVVKEWQKRMQQPKQKATGGTQSQASTSLPKANGKKNPLGSESSNATNADTSIITKTVAVFKSRRQVEEVVGFVGRVGTG